MTTSGQPQRFLGGFLGLFVLLALVLPDEGAALTLTWDPNPIEEGGGYKVYVGTSSGVYGSPTDIGRVTTYKPPGLQPNTTYFFAVKAYNSTGESGFSNEVSAFAVAVPNVVGLEQSAAVTALTTAGLVLGNVIMAASATVEAGVVVNQMPAAGELVARDSAVDPVVSSGPSSEGGGGGGGGCFIATAAYGSNLAGEVQLLRRFRDRYLLGHPPGRLLILLYYHISPPLAHAIEGSETLRTVARGTLRPVVWWADLALVSPGVAFGMGAVGLLAIPFVTFILFRGRRCKASRRSGDSEP